MKKEVFIIMPFSDTETCTEAQWTETFEHVFKPAFEEIGYSCERAKPEIGSLIKSIVTKLHSSFIVLADITDKNANVFYELGVRHSLSKRTIIVTQDSKHMPSDLKGYWHTVYSRDPKGVSDFKQYIKDIVTKIENNPSSSDSPVGDFLDNEHHGIKIMNITDAMNYALKSFPKLKQLSIFAISTSKSVAYFIGKPTLKIDRVDLLLRGFAENDIYYNEDLESQIKTSIDRWTDYYREENIKELNIYHYKFHSNNNFFLFDDSMVIIGNIHLENGTLVKSDKDVIVINNDTDLGKKIIQIYQRKFKLLLKIANKTTNNIPNIVDIEITNKCNLNCIYCFGPECSESDNDMPLDFWRNVLNFLKKSDCEGIVISGGEPTLYSNLMEVLKYAKSIGLSVLLSTNGLNKQTIIQCSYYCDTIALPLDAYEKDIIFKLRGINDYGLQDLISLAREIKKANSSVKIRVGSVATSFNCNSLIQLAKYLKSNASNDINIWKIYQYAARRKKLINANLLNITDDKFTSLQNEIKCVCSGVPFEIEFLSNEKRQYAYLFIYHDGTVVAPNQGNEEDLIFGNINTKGLNVLENIRNIDYKKNRNNYSGLLSSKRYDDTGNNYLYTSASDAIATSRKSKKSNVVKVVIASPGDTDIERKFLLDSLEVRFRKDGHEDHCGFRIMVTGWEELASQPGYPQDVINKKIIAESDFVVAIFHHKLGTPTKNTETGNIKAESGTVEELLQALDKVRDNHPIGMAYFYSQVPSVSLDNPNKENIEKEWKRLSEFKETIKDKMILKQYIDEKDLISMILKDLEKNIIDYLIK
ncbi:MAG: radical SAM protein [Fibromonadales bacterium]|nr:radical SAM protein [Fibromonadales bacterium]